MSLSRSLGGSVVSGDSGGVLPNNTRINGVEHFYQSSKPTVRGDGSALVERDRWYKSDDGTEWFWNGTYWLSTSLFPIGITPFLAGSVSSSTFAIGIPNRIFGERIEYSVYLIDRNNDVNDFWTIGFDAASYSNSVAELSLGSVNTQGLNASLFYSYIFTPSLLIQGTPNTSGTLSLKWWCRLTKTGSNANRISFAATLFYRTVQP